jgi:glutathione synthase/RimK-type ligase-like ATP-grasp enzyme
MTRVGLIGPPGRPEIQRLAMRLEERGAEGVLLDSSVDPRIRVTPDGEEACGLDLKGLRGVYVADLGLRPVFATREDGTVDADASRRNAAASRRHLAAWNALLERLASRTRVVNPPRTHDLHALKPWEAFACDRDGLTVPWTLAASDPAALRELPHRAGGWIAKGMVGGHGFTESFSAPKTARDAAARLDEAPVLVQERIQGDNLRVYVLGGRTIGSAEIVSIEGDETDSRRGEMRIRRVPLHPEAGRTAVAAARRWGLAFAAVDFMVEARTRRAFLLECNSAPFFLAFEQQTGWDISSRLADYLLGRP